MTEGYNIKQFILNNGDIVFGEIVGSEGEVYEVKNPIMLAVTQGGAQFISWPMFRSDAENKISIYKSALVTVPCEPDQKIREEYLKKFNKLILGAMI